MKILKITLITVLISLFTCGLVYGDKGGQGKGKGAVKRYEKRIMKNNPSVIRANKEISSQLSIGSSVISARGTGHNLEKIDKGVFNAAEKDVLIQDLETMMSSKSSEQANWGHHPFDERRQGNAGKPEMIAPYGADKGFDRVGSAHRRPVGGE